MEDLAVDLGGGFFPTGHGSGSLKGISCAVAPGGGKMGGKGKFGP